MFDLGGDLYILFLMGQPTGIFYFVGVFLPAIQDR